MKRLILALLAVFAGLALVIPVHSLATNADRLRRGLPPLPPVRRATPVAAAKRGVQSPSATIPSYFGQLQIRSTVATIGSTIQSLGYVINDALLGPTGITLLTSSALDVKFQGGEISVTDPLFPAPFFLGLNGTLPLALGSSASADFINVLEGVSSKVWTLDTSTGALNATWTNPDGTKILPALVYDSFHNWLNFTGDPAAFIAASTSVPPPQQVSIFLV